MAGKRVVVIGESKSGRNERFRDTATNVVMSRAEFVDAIERQRYPSYHVRRVRGVKTPVSNPDNKTGNNLG